MTTIKSSNKHIISKARFKANTERVVNLLTNLTKPLILFNKTKRF